MQSSNLISLLTHLFSWGTRTNFYLYIICIWIKINWLVYTWLNRTKKKKCRMVNLISCGLKSFQLRHNFSRLSVEYLYYTKIWMNSLTTFNFGFNRSLFFKFNTCLFICLKIIFLSKIFWESRHKIKI